MSWLEDEVLDPIGDVFSDVGSFLWAGVETGLNWVTGGLYEYAKNYVGDFVQGLVPEREYQDRQRTTRGGANERQIIYGRNRVGGQLIYSEDDGRDNTILWLCYVLAGHECEEVEAVYANGVKIAESNGPGVNGLMQQITNPVTDDNAVCWSVHGNRLAAFIPLADFVYTDGAYNYTDSPPNWTGDHKLSLQTYVWIALGFDKDTFGDTGLPKFTFDVKGKNDIYDPRDGLNKYTTNQALCTLDVLLWDRMFNASLSEIDTASFIDGANVADELVATADGGTEPRYTVNGTVSFNIRPMDLLQSMEEAGAGVAFWLQGEWTYTPGEYRAPVLDFDEGDLIGGFEFSSGPGKQAKHNVASGTYVDANQDFEVVGFPQLYVSSYVSVDGEVLEKTYEFPFTNSGTMARRLAKIDIERSRYGISASGVFKFRALRLTPGDRISLTLAELGWTPKVFRVTSSRPSWGRGVELTLREDAPEVYDWTEGDALALPPPPPLSLPDGLSISAPTNLEFTESLYETIDRQQRAQLRVTWPDQPSAEGYDIQYKPASSPTWIDAGTYWQDNEIFIRDLIDATYDVRVRSIGAFGRRSAWYEESYTIVATVPGTIDALSLQELANEPKHPDGVFSTVVVDTDPPADPNYSHSLIEYQEAGSPEWFRVGPTDDNGSARFVVLSDGKTYNVRAFAVSTFGVRSGVAVSASLTVSNSIEIDDPDVGSYLPAPSVNGLELTGQGNDDEFTGGDAKFEWRKTTVEQWYQIGSEGQLGASGGRLDQYFRDYQVEVWADVDGIERLIRTEFVVDPLYVYTFEKNAEDYRRKIGEAGAWRTFELRVYCRGRLNQLSAKPARLQVSNPAPAGLSDVQVIAGFNTISISYKRPDDLDFAGVQIWISQTQGFDPDAIEPTATVSDNSYVSEGLQQGETYYVRWRPFDEFGPEGATISSEISVTTKTGTDLSGLSGWAYEVDPVDREFVEANMADGAIDLASALVGGQLGGNKLADLAVSAAKLADGSVNLAGNKITGQLAGVNLADAAVSESKLADLSVGAAKLADGSVNLAGNKITGQLGQLNLADSAVTTSKLAELSITAAKLASSSVTATKIANLAVGTAAIANAAITNAKIANLAVDTAQIADAAIESAKIANLAVGTAAIANAAITNAKIANLAVDTAQIANAAITNAKIANLAVGTAAIQDLAVSDAKIQAVTAGKILTGTLAATETITSEGLIRAVDSLSSPTVQAGLGPTELTLDGVPFTALMWAFNASGVTFAIDELGNAYFAGELDAAGGTFAGALEAATGVLGNPTGNRVEYDGTNLIVESPFLNLDGSEVVFGDEPSGQYIKYSAGVFEVGSNATIGSNANRTVTVGAGGDFATLNAALEYLSRTIPAYISGGFTAEVQILSGTTISEQISIDGLNLGWIKITSQADATVTIDLSGLGAQYFVKCDNNASSPVIDFSGTETGSASGANLFDADNGATITFTDRGLVWSASQSSFIRAQNRAGVSCRGVSANNSILSNSGSDVDAQGCDLDGGAFFADGYARINAANTTVANVSLSGWSAEDFSTIYCPGGVLSGSKPLYGVRASGGSEINFRGTITGCGQNGAQSTGGSKIILGFGDVDNSSGDDLFVSNGGIIVASSGTTYSTANIAVNTLTASGIIFD